MLSLLNRRRFEQMTEEQSTIALSTLDRRLSKHIELLNQQLLAMPTPEALGSMRQSLLRHNRQMLHQLSTEITGLRQEVQARISPLEQQDWNLARQDICQLQDQYTYLCEAMARITSQLQRFSPALRMEDIDSAVAHLKSDVVQLRVNLQNLSNQTKPNLISLQDQVNHISCQFKKMPPPTDSTSLKQEVGELIKLVANLVTKRDWQTLTADLQALQQQQDQLKQSLELNKGITQTQMVEAINYEVQRLQQEQPAATAEPHSELIFDLKSTAHADGSMDGSGSDDMLSGSQAVLEEALETTQERLILIWPWSSQCRLDQALLHKIETFLQQGRQLDLGWCHRADRNELRLLNSIYRRWETGLPQRAALQQTLHQLLQLKRAYPDQFRFKILGTHENFLVADQSFAVLGIDDALKTTTVFSDLELKLRTRDADVIRRLTQRFDDPVLEDEDVAARWNRAVTRHDLGDRTGAIADLNKILGITPDDAAAYNYRGLIRYERRDRPGAVADFCEAVALYPGQADAFCNRGFIRAELGDQYGAIADYSLAIQAQPDTAIAYFCRGMANQNLGHQRTAIDDFSDAIRLMPSAAVAHYYRGMARQRIGDQMGAIDDLEVAARLFQNQGNSANAEKILSGISRLEHMTAVAS